MEWLRRILRGSVLVAAGMMLGWTAPAASVDSTWTWDVPLGRIEDPSLVTIQVQNVSPSTLTVNWEVRASGSAVDSGSAGISPGAPVMLASVTCGLSQSPCNNNFIAARVTTTTGGLLPSVIYTPYGQSPQVVRPGDIPPVGPSGTTAEVVQQLKGKVDLLTTRVNAINDRTKTINSRTVTIINKLNRILDRL